MICWTHLLPQAVLLLLNFRMLGLVWGDMTAPQRTHSRALVALEILLILFAAAVAAVRRCKSLTWPFQLPLMLLPIGYLCYLVFGASNLIPASASLWILPVDQFYYCHFALMMPGIFYGALLLSCFETKMQRAADVGLSLAIALGLPLTIYAGLSVMRWIHAEKVIIGFFIAATVLMGGAILRAMVNIYAVLRQRGPVALSVLTFLIGIAGPIGGLLLNRTVPFPADFQATSVYAMAALNGLLLLLPNFANIRLHRAVWLAQCALFPFTLYFFVVFLPFLPLSLPAILAMGCGFLMLTPTALFLVHTLRIRDGFLCEIRDGSKLRPALLGLVAVALIPAFYTAQAVRDRVVLRRALDYVYSPDLLHWSRFEGSPAVLRRSLENLRDFKAGLQLPFLSGFYNWLVFDNLVLPDDKMQRLHRVFFGDDMKPASKDKMSMFAPSRRNEFSVRETNGTPPPQTAILRDIQQHTETEGVCSKTLLTLRMHNPTSQQSEFVTRIALPDGVLVSGFWLHIGTERVPGRIYEKKTALWVYQKIRDVTRRDPGLLLFLDPRTVELRVFPFASNEERTVEIELLYPTATDPRVAVGTEALRLSSGDGGSQIALVDAGEHATAAVFNGETAARLPAFKRTPYLHFIVDRSAHSTVDPQRLEEIIRAAAAQFPDASEGRLTFANYECQDVSDDLVPLEKLKAESATLSLRGSFLASSAIEHSLLQYHEKIAHAPVNSPWLRQFPIVVVIGAPAEKERDGTVLAQFANLAPDSRAWFETSDGKTLTARFFDRAETGSPIHPVVQFRLGDTNAFAAAWKGAVVQFETKSHGAELSVFDPELKSYSPITDVISIPSDSRYSKGIAASLENLGIIFNPSIELKVLPEVVRLSREAGVMIAATSYIVVENSAQWEILARKEKQKLANSSALEIQSVPEPSTWILIGIGAFCFAARIRRGKSSAFPFEKPRGRVT